jgi:hypothetical protein
LVAASAAVVASAIDKTADTSSVFSASFIRSSLER